MNFVNADTPAFDLKDLKRILYKEDQIKEIARHILSVFKGLVVGYQQAYAQKQALVVGLSGDLGAGKTTFSQNMARLLGVEDRVTSPTFVIEKVYHTKDTAFPQFIHIDAYRLDGGKELAALGFDGLLEDPGNLIFIEWPERVGDILPKGAIVLKFSVIDESTREIEAGMMAEMV